MAQTTMTQYLKGPKCSEESVPNQAQQNHQTYATNPVTPLIRTITNLNQSEVPASSQSTIEVQSYEETQDFDETAVLLTAQQVEEFTQKWNIYDDDNDVLDDEPEPIDFSQTQPTQHAADEKFDGSVEANIQREMKRSRYNELPVPSLFPKMPIDTENKWHLVVDGELKIFKVGEQFCIGAQVNTRHPERVYTIQKFFNDPKVGKMAQCHVKILAQTTIIGKDNPAFKSMDFETKFGSKYVSCRYSQNKALRKLKWLKNTTGISIASVFFDPPTRETKGPGWTLGFSFNESFGENDTCFIKETPVSIDSFAGSGAMGRCLQDAGFKVSHAIDNDPVVVATLKLNHGSDDTRAVCQDVEEFFDDAENAEKGSPYFIGHASHFHCSSPCQGFSRMNTTGSEENKEQNNRLSLVFPRVVIKFKLTTASFENVTGMLDKDRLHYVQNIMLEFIMNDYQVRVGILDSSNYGDPQKRLRVIMLVSRKGCKLPDLPKPTHGEPPLRPIRTPRDAIGDLEVVQPREKPGILVLPSGIEVDHHFKCQQEGEKEYAKTDSLEADKPANTVLCGHEIKHYKLQRGCTNLEAARLQSFPDDWHFAGNAKQVQKQIGNAVPMGLARAIADAIYDVYELNDYFFSESPMDAK